MTRSRPAPRSESIGPWLVKAFFCREIRHEASGGLTYVDASFEFYTSNTADDPRAIDEPLDYWLVLCFARGKALGRRQLKIDTISPSGRRQTSIDWPIEFTADKIVLDVNVQIKIPYDERGMLWYEVRLDGKPITRVPCWVEYQTWEETQERDRRQAAAVRTDLPDAAS